MGAKGSRTQAVKRWDWIDSNPAEVARKPRQPTPQPTPPTAEQASRIIEAAWEQGESWGTLVWLVMVTGMRRAEVLVLRWGDVDLASGYVSVRRNYVRVGGRLGHAGGGATTLRVYAAWVGEADRRAADILGSRMQRPSAGAAQ